MFAHDRVYTNLVFGNQINVFLRIDALLIFPPWLKQF